MPFLNPAQPPSLEESEKMLNESLKKLEKATQDLKKSIRRQPQKI